LGLLLFPSRRRPVLAQLVVSSDVRVEIAPVGRRNLPSGAGMPPSTCRFPVAEARQTGTASMVECGCGRGWHSEMVTGKHPCCEGWKRASWGARILVLERSRSPEGEG
jgi:hypothetical protein